MTMDAQQNVLKTGTSTIGITFDGGVVVGADHRATMGHFIANKSVQKLFKIGDNLALTTAGLVGHAQSLSRTLSAEVALFQLRRQQPMTVRGAATLTANILSGRPHWVQLLIVGVDDEGGHWGRDSRRGRGAAGGVWREGAGDVRGGFLSKCYLFVVFLSPWLDLADSDMPSRTFSRAKSLEQCHSSDCCAGVR